MARPSRRRRSKSSFFRRRYSLRMTTLAAGVLASRARRYSSLDRQLVAAFGSPCLEDPASPSGFHPRPKAVHTHALALFGLPRSFRHGTSSHNKIDSTQLYMLLTRAASLWGNWTTVVAKSRREHPARSETALRLAARTRACSLRSLLGLTGQGSTAEFAESAERVKVEQTQTLGWSCPSSAFYGTPNPLRASPGTAQQPHRR